MHGGHNIFASGNNLGASGESMIRGAARTNDYGRAEIALLGNTVRQVKIDDVAVYNRDRGQSGSDIPSTYEESSGKTLNEKLMEYLVTIVAPHLVDQFEDVFGGYYDDDMAERMQGRTGDTVADLTDGDGDRPTSGPTHEASIVSLGDEET